MNNSEPNSTTNAAQIQPTRLDNLPAEMTAATRWLPVKLTVDGRKVPTLEAWQKPENWRRWQDVSSKLKGFAIGDDYVFIDFDHVLNDAGEFLYDDARRWFNYLAQSDDNVFCERSISGHGLHMFAVPTAGKFPKVASGRSAQIVFDASTGAKIELFYKTGGRWCLMTGDLYGCEPNATIPHGAVADEIFQQLLNAVAKQHPSRTSGEPARGSRSDDNTAIMRDILAVVDPSKLEYQDWLDLLFCAKRYGLSLDEFDAFSRRDTKMRRNGRPRYDPQALQASWRSAKTDDELDDGGIKIGTAIEIGKTFGYKPPRKTLSQDTGDNADLIDFLFQGDTSDLDFARRLEAFRPDRARWLTDAENWLLWQDNSCGGAVWKRGSEKNSCVLPLARELSDAMTSAADTKDECELANSFKSSRKWGQVITCLKSLDSILITSTDLDTHPELLNCLNGVVDLQTGALMAADPSLYLTQQCAAAYDANADTATLETFFAQIMPDEPTRAGLLRWLGYCLTGETAEEKFAVWIGRTGANGKGTLSNALLKLFGDYGAGLSPKALLKGNRGADADRATTSLNALEGARFAISEEMDMSGELDSSLAKNLSGGDGIDLRRNYGEFRKVPSSAKLNISGNFMPKIENVHDGGILRRLIVFAFNVTFSNPDKTLKRRLCLPENLRGLLTLLVREAQAWYRDGDLIVSEQMTDSRDELLSDSDFVNDFLSEYYVFGDGLKIRVQELIDDLRDRRRCETRPYKKDADLVRLVAAVDGVSVEYDKHLKQKVFNGLAKLTAPPNQGERGGNSYCGEIISSADY